jgi:nucleotide-diphospho-sugar transferase
VSFQTIFETHLCILASGTSSWRISVNDDIADFVGTRFRHVTWIKVPMIRRALEDYRFVVFLDADAVFVEPQVPLEWLFDRWNIHDGTLLAMAEDPNLPRNLDSRGHVLWNTGFVIAQNSKRTKELFWDWEQCPTDSKFPGCKHWTQDWAHEQAAFGNHVRYAYNDTDELRAISCMEGNGSPHINEKDCGGIFVAHHWSKKRQTLGDLGNLISRGLALSSDGRAAADEFVRQKGEKLSPELSEMLLSNAKI